MSLFRAQRQQHVKERPKEPTVASEDMVFGSLNVFKIGTSPTSAVLANIGTQVVAVSIFTRDGKSSPLRLFRKLAYRRDGVAIECATRGRDRQDY